MIIIYNGDNQNETKATADLVVKQDSRKKLYTANVAFCKIQRKIDCLQF